MKPFKQQMQRTGILYGLLTLLMASSLVACRENAIKDLSPADSKVYITNYDRSVNFSQYKTFSLSDSVVIESNDGYRPTLGALESRFVTSVANAMTSRGFQRVARGQKADLGVAVIRVDNLYTGVGVNNSYYGSYWGGGYGGLGGYSSYYPTYYTYQVADQYWEIQIVDLKNAPATTGTNTPQLNVIYEATVQGSDVTDTQSADEAITALFLNHLIYRQLANPMKRIIALTALLALTSTAWAQYQNEYLGNSSIYDRYVTFTISARYAVAFPMGGQQGYINKVSPTNFALEGEWLFPKRFSIGLKTGYQYTQQRFGRQVYQYGDQSISAVQTRTFSVIPAMVSLSYYFADNAAAIRPYVQFAGGGAFVDYTNYFGPLADQQTGFKGAIAPAIGLKYYGRREQGFGAEIQAQYQQLFFTYDLLKNSAPSLMLSAGVVYRWY